MSEVFERAMFLEMCDYPRDYRECVSQAIDELVSDEELADTYNLYGISHEEYVQDMAQAFLRYKASEIRRKCQSLVE